LPVYIHDEESPEPSNGCNGCGGGYGGSDGYGYGCDDYSGSGDDALREYGDGPGSGTFGLRPLREVQIVSLHV